MAGVRSLLLSFVSGVVFCFVAVYLSVPLLTRDTSLGKSPQRTHGSTVAFKAPHVSLWKDLDRSEATALHEYIFNNFDAFGLEGTGFDNNTLLSQVELLRPNKSEVVKFLDDRGDRPKRYARASIISIKNDSIRYLEYMVGPLPPSASTNVLPLTYPYHKDQHAITSPVSNIWDLWQSIQHVGEEIADITEDLFGARVNMEDPDDPEGLMVGARPVMMGENQTVLWLELFRNGPRSDSRSLLPQGLYVKIYWRGSDSKTWTIGDWFYNGMFYDNVTALREAMHSPNFVRLSQNLNGAWADAEDFDSGDSARSKPPPVSIQPNGGRYKLDKNQQYVSWEGFSFFIATAQSTAMSLFDIRYNGTRIIYHFGLQEALAHYAGSEPMQSGLEFLDTAFGMGDKMFSLVPGIDCPAYAEYLDVTYSTGGETFAYKNAICIFEFTSDVPLQRHTAEGHVTVSRNTYLVVRSVSTVGNYDYTIDYLFYIDGSIEVKVRASGYIFGAYSGLPEPIIKTLTSSDELRPRDQHLNPNITNEYGYRIHPSVSTSIHDHVLLFRCDLDISPCSGHSDTFSRVSLTPLTETYPWDAPESPTRNTMHLTHHPLTSESALNWPRNSADLYLFQSNETNRWGERRSYRVQPGTGMGTPSHLTILESTALGRSASWSAADLWVLRNRDEEPMGAHYFNYLSPDKPLVDFADLANNEPLHPYHHDDDDNGSGSDGDDLVLYFNLGGHHVPHSGDIPNTLMHTSASSVMLTPFNYFDEDVSRARRQGVRVDAWEHDGVEKGVKWFGGRYGSEEGKGKGELRLDIERDVEPSVDGYFEEGEDGKIVGNKVGGGLFGGRR